MLRYILKIKPFRVLSIDGGGIRGLYTASLLQQLGLRLSRFHNNEVETRLDIGRQFDLIIGTSTGAILATSLAAGVALEDVLRLYRTKAAKIFQFPMPLQKGCFGDRTRALIWALRNTFSPATLTKGKSKRSRYGFWPDRAVEIDDIQLMFKQGLHYVGDWHTHPEVKPSPSTIDNSKILDIFHQSTHELDRMLMVIVGLSTFPEGLFVGAVQGTEIIPMFVE